MVWGSQGLNPPEDEQFVTVRKRFSGMRMSGASGNAGEEGGDEVETADSFGFGEGGFYSFHSFRRKAHDFRDKWFSGWNRCVRSRIISLAPFVSALYVYQVVGAYICACICAGNIFLQNVR
jgi:hypothetical protein